MRRKMVILSLILALVTLPILAACAQPTPALTVADFYGANNVRLIYGGGAGGGGDYFGRLFSSYWPMVVEDGAMAVVNMKPATTSVNYVYAAEPDGLTLSLTFGGGALVGPIIFEQPGVEWELDKFNWIGSVCEDEYAFDVGVNSPIESLEDLQKAEGLKFGAQEYAFNAMTVGAAMTVVMLGLKDVQLICGYDSSTEVALAAAKGEVDGGIFDTSSIHAYGVEGEFLKVPPLVIVGLKRSPWFPDVPQISEIVDIAPEMEQNFVIFESLKGRYTLAAPPGVPADRVQFLRDRFDEIVILEPFLTQLKLRFPILAVPLTGDELAELMGKAAYITPEDTQELEELMKAYLPF